MSSDESSQVLLKDAVETIEAIIRDEGHGGRGHLMHYLFAVRAAGREIDYTTLACLTGYPFAFYYCHDNYHVAYGIPDGWEDRVARHRLRLGVGPHSPVRDALCRNGVSSCSRRPSALRLVLGVG